MEEELNPLNSISGTTDEAFPTNKMLPIQKSDFSTGFFSPDRMIQDFNNFKKSAAPSRFLSFRNDAWVDFPRQVFDVLAAGFLAGKTTLEIPIDGNLYLFDFLRMTQIDSSTGVQNSIAWIDVEGQCFFPRTVIEEQRNLPSSKLEIEIRIDKPSSLKRRRDSLDSTEEHSKESQEVSSAPSLDRPRWPGVEILRDGDRFYKVVEKLFLAGMRRLAADTVVTSVHKCSHSGPLGMSRLKAFQMLIRMTKAARGDANVKFGWYGASSKVIAGSIGHGFGSDYRVMRSGVYLSPPHSPYPSSLLSEPDEGGERHIVLCRVIMGKSEGVDEGSSQYHPSSEEFDSGVDNFVNPKCYMVWSTHMNTHIRPEYVVSFKASNLPPGKWRAASSAATGQSLSKLFAEMGRSLPASRMQALKSLYNQRKEGKMSKDTFIRYLRSIAGDKLLTSTIRKIRGH